MQKKYILVHGAWHGSWEWRFVKEILSAEGHTVITIDLPGHGDSRLALSEMTMDAYVSSVSDLLAKQEEQVILVGHSMSGAVIAQAAEQHPNKVEKLIYVCAFLLPNGKSVLDVMGEDKSAEFGSRLSFNEDQSGAKFDDATFRETFYNTSSEDKIEWAKPQLLEYQPVSPLAQPVRVTEAKFGSLPRIYIKTMNDKVLTPSAQQKLIDGLACEKVIEIQTDHAPFASAPEELAEALISSAA